MVPELPAQQMPWTWTSDIACRKGPRRRFEVKVNGRHWLTCWAQSAVTVVRSCLPSLPSGARVAVRRIR